MRISKEKAAENRAALIRAASKLFREHGIDGVGVAEISKEAGLTHGALYAHFKSKEELALEALSFGFDETSSRIYASTIDGMPDLTHYVSRYLSKGTRDDYGGNCPMSASASEIGRQDKPISARYAEGYMVIVRAFERQIAETQPGSDALGRAMVIVATLIGVQAVARGTAKGNPALSEQVLQAALRTVEELMQPAQLAPVAATLLPVASSRAAN